MRDSERAALARLNDLGGDRLVREHTIYAAVVGSRAFGLDTDASDTDTRGVYVAPTEAFWSLAKRMTRAQSHIAVQSSASRG